MRFELKVAWRFLKDGGNQTIFILLGIAVGVSVQIFLGTLIDGLQKDLINTTVGSSPHVVLLGSRQGLLTGSREKSFDSGQRAYIEGGFRRTDENIRKWRDMQSILDRDDDLTAVLPIAEGNAFLIRGGDRWPILLRGVESDRADSIYRIFSNLESGIPALDGNRILIGKDLAEETRLFVGDNFTVELPGGGVQLFTVGGIFNLGVQSLNQTWIFMDLNRAQRLMGFGSDISRIEVQVKKIFDADIVSERLMNQFSDTRTENWKDQNADLLAGLQAQSSSSITIQAFVLLAVTLGIASVLAVSVIQKSRQIGILKAMGTTTGSAARIFLFQGAILGFFGAILGSATGYGITELFLWGTAQSTGQPLFPLEFNFRYALAIVLIATLASIFSAMLPAQRSAGLNPIDVIRG